MDYLTLVVLALGLAMDAFAVSISNGMCYVNYHQKEQLKTAIAFGFFQGIMPVFGYLGGLTLSNFMTNIDHWIAFVFLGFIGGKMIKDAIVAFKDPNTLCNNCQKPFTTKTLVVQAIATSIDAFAVGISFAALDVNIAYAGSIIMLITFVMCVIGGKLGRKFGEVLSTKATLLGGIVLVAIGFKILIEHLFI